MSKVETLTPVRQINSIDFKVFTSLFLCLDMTYDKLARAIRYYYSSGIILSNPGRFTFRFGSRSGFRYT